MKESDRSTRYNLNCEINNVNDARKLSYDYIDNNSMVLDVGCACGALGAVLNDNKNCCIVGMEYDTKSVELAKQTEKYKAVYQVDLNNFKSEYFKKYYNCFDFIVLNDVLEHLLCPEEVLTKLKMFLRENGCFVISLPNISHASIKSNLLFNDFSYTDVGILDKTHIKFFTHKNISAFLTQQGLNIEDINVTCMGVLGFQPQNPYPLMSRDVLKLIYGDVHSFVLQYVVKCTLSNKETIAEHNFKKLSLKDFTDSEYLLAIQTSYFKKTGFLKFWISKIKEGLKKLLLKYFESIYLKYLYFKYKENPDKLKRIIARDFSVSR